MLVSKLIRKTSKGLGGIVSAMLVLGICAVGQGQTVYLSQVGSVGGGASIADPGITHNITDAGGSLFLWVTDGQRVNQTFSVNITSETPGVIGLTGATVFNPFVDLGIPAISDDRWQGIGGGSGSPDMIQNIVGVSVTDGFGFNPGVSGNDPLYDVGAGAWLFAQIDYAILGVGTTGLGLSVGPVDIVDDGISVAGLFDYGKASIEVVPEPAGLVLWLGITGLGLTRRRGFRRASQNA